MTAANAQDRDLLEKAETMLVRRDQGSSDTHDPDALRHGVFSYLESQDDGGYPLPIPAVSDLLAGGLRPGETTLVGGWTSHGKSIWVDQCLERCAGVGAHCHLYINEMMTTARSLRTVARLSGVPYSRLRRRNLEQDHHKAVLDTLNGGLPFGITQCSGWSAADIARDMRYRRYDVVGVDILHLIDHREERDLAQISSTLTAAAKVSGSHLIAAVHLNEERAKQALLPPPVLRDIRGSGMLKNDADNVLFVHRWQEEQRGPDGELTGFFVPGAEAGIIVAKARHGEVGGIKAKFEGERMRFIREAPEGSVA